jgi:N-acetyl-gamma-glutamyl-phosphate reductase
MKRIKTAVIGASGYSGIELLRILVRHPGAELVAVTSRQFAGKTLETVFPRFRACGPEALLEFIGPDMDAVAASGAEIAFLALPHGVASEFAIGLLARGLKVIDLSADFRLDDPAVYQEFYDHPHPAPELLKESVYGLPEVHGAAISQARLVASPGCYPTSVLLPLIPLLRAKLVDPDSICVFSMSGVSGAGRKEALPLLFCECNESLRPYSVPKHRHLSEMEQELSRAAGRSVVISFTPHLVPVTAGMLTTTYVKPAAGLGLTDLETIYTAAYADEPFVRLLGRNNMPDTKNVVGTNFLDLGWAWDPRTARYVLMSALDNLWKGAASQAMQSFNLLNQFPAVTGLQSV